MSNPLRSRLMVALAAVFALAGVACADTDDDIEPDPPQNGEDTEQTDEAYNEADTEFLQLMVPHHEEAVEMAEMVPERTERQELNDLADAVIASQEAEIDEMSMMLEEAGSEPASMQELHDDHSDVDMPGMMDHAEMEQLGDASDEDFDVRFVEMMIEHHQGAIVMAEDVLAEGEHPDVAQLAEDVIDEQQAEVEMMENWLQTWR